MKVTKCPLKKRCWDYGDCDECDIGIDIIGLHKQIDRLKTKNTKLEEALKVASTETARAIVIELAEKLKYSNHIFKTCASNLVSPQYVNGRCDAYQEFIDMLDCIVGKYSLEVKKDEDTK